MSLKYKKDDGKREQKNFFCLSQVENIDNQKFLGFKKEYKYPYYNRSKNGLIPIRKK